MARRGDPAPPAARALPGEDARPRTSTTSTPRPTGSSTCSPKSSRRGSTARSATRRTTRTGIRSRTRSCSGLSSEPLELERTRERIREIGAEADRAVVADHHRVTGPRRLDDCGAELRRSRDTDRYRRRRVGRRERRMRVRRRPRRPAAPRAPRDASATRRSAPAPRQQPLGGDEAHVVRAQRVVRESGRRDRHELAGARARVLRPAHELARGHQPQRVGELLANLYRPKNHRSSGPSSSSRTNGLTFSARPSASETTTSSSRASFAAVERVRELVALNDVVVATGLVAPPVLRVAPPGLPPTARQAGARSRSQPARRRPVVDTVHLALRESPRRSLLHCCDSNQESSTKPGLCPRAALSATRRRAGLPQTLLGSRPWPGSSSFLRNPFSFFSTGSRKEERIAAYIVREHERGRPLDEILADDYVRNRCTDAEVARLLDRPEIVHALGEGARRRAPRNGCR